MADLLIFLFILICTPFGWIGMGIIGMVITAIMEAKKQ